MKKIISIILTLTVLFLFLLSYAHAQEPVTFSLQDEKVYAGDEFTVNVFVSDNSQIAGSVIDINYDKEKLEFISAKEGAILDAKGNISIRNINIDKSYVRFTYMSATESVSAEGILFSVTFKALENSLGTTNLEITIPNAADLVNNALEKIPYSVENAEIVILDNISIGTTTESPTDNNEEISQTDAVQNETTGTINEENDKNNKDNDSVIIAVLIIIGVLLICLGSIISIKKKKK